MRLSNQVRLKFNYYAHVIIALRRGSSVFAQEFITFWINEKAIKCSTRVSEFIRLLTDCKIVVHRHGIP